MMQRRWTGLLVLMVCVATLALYGPSLVGLLLSNLGMVGFRDALLIDGGFAGACPQVTYPRQGVLTPPSVQRQIILFHYALRYNDGASAARWGLARAALSVGDSVAASVALRPIIEQTRHNRLMYHDALAAFYHAGDTQSIIALDGEARAPRRPLDLQTRRDLDRIVEATYGMIASAYLEVGDFSSMKRVKQLYPYSLAANYNLWQQSKSVEDDETSAEYREALIYSAPTHMLLMNYDTAIIPELVLEGIWDRRKALDVVVFLVWHGTDSMSNEDLLRRLAQLNSGEPDWYYYLGEFYYLQGRLGSAVAAYKSAMSADPRYSRAYLRLGEIAQSSCEPVHNECRAKLVEALRWYERYWRTSSNDPLGLVKRAEAYAMLEKGWAVSADGDTPWSGALWREWVNQLSVRGPEIVASQAVTGSGWTFLGYTGDEEALARGEPTSLWLFWAGPPGCTVEGEGWYHLGNNRWVQFIEKATNLVLNGGFELGTYGGLPFGFPERPYEAHLQDSFLTVSNREGASTTVMVLANSIDERRTGLVSMPVAIDPDALYLQLGWILAENGRALMGRNWDGKDLPDLRGYSYVAYNAVPEEWQHYAGVAEPLPKTQQAEIWLLNYDSTGRAYFDNVAFVRIGNPAKEGCH